MVVRIKIDPVERITEAMIRADLVLPAQKKAAADFARAGLEDAKESNRLILGRVPPFTTTVDGRRGAALESVNPDGGSIIFEFDLVVDVLSWIADKLIERSPVVSGRYRRGHVLLADGVEVALGREIPAADEYVFVNHESYARKIEVGKTESGRAFVIQVANKIYERTASDANSRFGNIAAIKFGYRELTDGYALHGNNTSRHFLRGGRVYREPTIRADRQAGSVVPSPAITVTYEK
jgi:hypothetical protein